MAKLLKPALLLLTLCGLTWLAVIIYWQESQRSPSGLEIALWLIALPLTLFGLIAIFVSGSRAARRAGQSAPTAPESKATTDLGPDTSRQLHFVVIESLHLSVLGARSNEAAGNLRGAACGPTPDAELTDEEGLPVLTARRSALDEDRLTAAREAAESLSTAPANDWPDERFRSLALAQEVLQKLAARAFEHSGLALHQQQAAPDALALSRGKNAEPLPLLRVQLQMPSGWPPVQQEGVCALLRQAVEAQALAAGWPLERLQVAADSVGNASESLLNIDRMLVLLSQQQSNDICLFLAAESFIGEQSMGRWQQGGRLRSVDHVNGQIPGEAAAGLLLTPPGNASAYEVDTRIQLHRTALAERNKPVTAKGRQDADTLKQLADRALAAAQLATADCALLVSDIEPCPASAVEMGLLITEHFPHLSAGEDGLLMGSGTGHCGAASALAALAIAHAEAMSLSAPVLCLSAAHAQWRAAVVLQPAPVAPAVSA